MKKILMALVMSGFVYISAEAQETLMICGKAQDKVCRRVGNSTSCYTTKYAQNFPVCKGDYGYFICCEAPNNTNSTFPELPISGLNSYKAPQTDYYVMENTNKQEEAARTQEPDMTAPQSQSYPDYSANVATSYEGYYPAHHIRVCSNSNNVAEENRAPYNGCPSPAYDGPDKNRSRNVNVSTPNANAPLAPITGSRY